MQPAEVVAVRHCIGDGDETDLERTEDDAHWTTECNAGECCEGQVELQASGSGQIGSADLQSLAGEETVRIGADAQFEDLVYQGREEISSDGGWEDLVCVGSEVSVMEGVGDPRRPVV